MNARDGQASSVQQVVAPSAELPIKPEQRSAAAPEIELSVVLPCLNEAETLAVCISKALGSMDRLGIRGEVVVADNGSTDGSQAIAIAAGARVVDVDRRGYGAAVHSGIQAARGIFVLMADADDSYALDDIGPYVEKLREGADLVMGNRFQGGIAPGAMPWLHRYLGNPILSFLGRKFFNIPVGDFHCGMRAFRRESILGLGMRTDGMEFASEMVVRASVQHLSIEEVPTTLRPDGRSRPPHLRTWPDGWRHLRFLLAFSPRWLMLYPALGLLALGLVCLVVLAFITPTIGSVSFSISTMLAGATAFIAGGQLIGVALISRSYATHLGLLPASSSIERLLERITLERGLLTGSVGMLSGMGCYLAALIRWGRSGFGPLDPLVALRLPILGSVFILGGLQLMMVSFTLSLPRINRSHR